MDSPPSWYRLLKAAQWLGVAPWELATQPAAWVNMAEEAQLAEAHAEKVHEKRHQS